MPIFLLGGVIMLAALPLCCSSSSENPKQFIFFLPPFIVPFVCVLCYYQSLSLFSMGRNREKWVYATLSSNILEANMQTFFHQFLFNFITLPASWPLTHENSPTGGFYYLSRRSSLAIGIPRIQHPRKSPILASI